MVDKRSLHAHIESEGLEHLLKELRRDRRLTAAAMGGSDADLDTRKALWLAEAAALTGQNQDQTARDDTRSRLAESIRGDNTDGLHRLMRVSRETRS